MPQLQPTASVWLEIAKLVIPFITGFFSAVAAEPIRRKIFKPVLALEFKDQLEFKTLTPETMSFGDSQAYYLRIRVNNKSWFTAVNCRAHLVNIELKKDGVFQPTEFVDTLRLAWSCQPSRQDAFRAIDIPKSVNQFVDVLSVRPRFRTRGNTYTFKEELRPGNFYSTFSLETQLKPLRYEKFENSDIEVEYRYTILVTADGADPAFIKLVFKWTKDWEKFDAWKDK